MTPSLALQIAEDPHSTVEQLVATQAFLSRPAIAQALASNPSTPPQTLAKLLARYPEGVSANPVFPLLFLENPGWLEAAMQDKELEYLLNHPTLPPFLVEHLRHHANAKVRAAAEAHIVMGFAVQGWEQEIAQRIAALPCPKEDLPQLRRYELIPKWLIPFLSPPQEHSQGQTQEEKALSLAERKRILSLSKRERENLALRSRRASVLALLAEDDDTNVRWLVAQNAYTPGEVLAQFGELGVALECLIHHPATPPKTLEQILTGWESGDVPFPLALTYKPFPRPMQMSQAQYERIKVLSLSHNDATPLEEFLKRIESRAVSLSEALTRWDTPRWLHGEVLMQGSSKRNAPLSWFCGLLATEKPKRLMDATRSDAWYTRFAAAIHPLTNANSLERLANDGNRYVRAAAQNRLDDASWRFIP